MDNDQLVRSWSSENVLDYYLKHRDNTKELYDSEKIFIKDALKNGGSVLDIGCAAGGFSKIVREYNKNIEYTGVDISPQMISLAKKRFPNDKFYLCSGEKLDFPDNSFDTCICFGVLHMTERWKELLSEAWRICRGTLLFDLRLVDKEGICDAELSYQRLEFDMKWDGISKAPYVIVSLLDAVDHVASLAPKARSLSSYGYWAPVSKMTVSKYKDVCMSVFCLSRDGRSGILDWGLPLDAPGDLKQKLFS